MDSKQPAIDTMYTPLTKYNELDRTFQNLLSLCNPLTLSQTLWSKQPGKMKAALKW